MLSYRIAWEDEAKAREVEIMVDYRLDAGVAAVEAIRPLKVTFYNAETGRPTAVLPVHTATGRRLLADAYLASREGESLEDEIQTAHAARMGRVPHARPAAAVA